MAFESMCLGDGQGMAMTPERLSRPRGTGEGRVAFITSVARGQCHNHAVKLAEEEANI